MNKKREMIRYGFEHRLLPHLLYEGGQSMISAILKERGKIFQDLYEVMYQDEVVGVSAEDFDVNQRMFANGDDDEVVVIRVSMPKPVQTPECRAVYFCSNKKGCETLYFTSELSAEGEYHLCAWTEQREHLNFGKDKTTEDFETVASLYKELIFNGGITNILEFMD